MNKDHGCHGIQQNRYNVGGVMDVALLIGGKKELIYLAKIVLEKRRDGHYENQQSGIKRRKMNGGKIGQ